VTLEWAPPLDPGGRSDITYNAVCRRCPWALSHCEACGSGTRFVPQQTSLAQASLLVANLLAHMNYSFWIEAVNGVSHLSPEPRRAAVVNITTNQAGRQGALAPSHPGFEHHCGPQWATDKQLPLLALPSPPGPGAGAEQTLYTGGIQKAEAGCAIVSRVPALALPASLCPVLWEDSPALSTVLRLGRGLKARSPAPGPWHLCIRIIKNKATLMACCCHLWGGFGCSVLTTAISVSS
jgi:hypothetical protein